MRVEERDIQRMACLVVAEGKPTSGSRDCLRCERMLCGLAEMAGAGHATCIFLASEGRSRELEIRSACAWGVHGPSLAHWRNGANGTPQPASDKTLLADHLAPLIKDVRQAMGSYRDQVSSDPHPHQFRSEGAIFSIARPLNSQSLHVLAISRWPDGPALANRCGQALGLLHELATKVCSLCAQSHQLLGSELPPHLQRVAQELLRGEQEKQVAVHVGLTANTVHQYIKAIYRHLGVSSRAEFMAQCLNLKKPRSSGARELEGWGDGI